MRLLLTSAGISNASIERALVSLLGKPIAEASALFVPTAIYALSGGGEIARKVICGTLGDPFCELGWKSLGVLELSALPSLKEEHWVPMLQKTDALLVGGGDPSYLCYWMWQSGLGDPLASLLREMVYVGLSAGSMVTGPQFETFGRIPPTGSDRALGLVDFALLPHLDYPAFPENSLANLEILAARMAAPTYAIDDQTAIKVIDGAVEVVTEGHWKLFPAGAEAR